MLRFEYEARERLQFIVRESELLMGYGFAEHFFDRGFTHNINFSGNNMEPSDIPRQEFARGACNVIRMFSQGHDGIRLFRDNWSSSTPLRPSPPPSWTEDPTISDEWRTYYYAIQDRINTYFTRNLSVGGAGGIHVQASHNGQRLTMGLVYDVYTYGVFGHSNPDKRAIYEEWQNNELLGPLIETAIYDILIELISYIKKLAQVSQMELDGVPIPLPIVDGVELAPRPPLSARGTST